ncbi:MAG TPA: hypothetical protein VF466_00920 [Candidatus Saccharimonadales bacterium]
MANEGLPPGALELVQNHDGSPACAMATLRAQLQIQQALEELGGAAAGEQYPTLDLPTGEPLDCRVCGGDAQVNKDGNIDAPSCLVSGSCEDSWSTLRPEAYYRPDGRPVAAALPCGGLSCAATLRLVTELGTPQHPPKRLGPCAVDRAGAVFRLDEWRRREAGGEPPDWERPQAA